MAPFLHLQDGDLIWPDIGLRFDKQYMASIVLRSSSIGFLSPFMNAAHFVFSLLMRLSLIKALYAMVTFYFFCCAEIPFSSVLTLRAVMSIALGATR